jgi:hypothetical protein
MLRGGFLPRVSDERRTAPRFDRILRVRWSHGGEDNAVVTLDIGPAGVYLLTPSVPAPGELVSIQVEEPGPSVEPVELVAQVVRVVQRKAAGDPKVPGSALRWIRASTTGNTEYLRSYLQRILGMQVDTCVWNGNQSIYEFDNEN